MVITQEPAEALAALHGAFAAELCVTREQQDVAFPLVIPLGMVMFDIFPQGPSQGALAKENHLAQAILAGHHQVSADECAELGGKDVGPSPSELLCAALCACTAITLRMYAERKSWPLRGVQVDVPPQRERQGRLDRAA
jgi:hypothetical protein